VRPHSIPFQSNFLNKMKYKFMTRVTQFDCLQDGNWKLAQIFIMGRVTGRDSAGPKCLREGTGRGPSKYHFVATLCRNGDESQTSTCSMHCNVTAVGASSDGFYNISFIS